MANIEILTNARGLDEMESALNEVVRRIAGEAVSGIEKEGVLPDVDTRRPAAAGEERPEGGELEQGVRASELAKEARAHGQHFDCATWLHKALKMPREQFR